MSDLQPVKDLRPGTILTIICASAVLLAAVVAAVGKFHVPGGSLIFRLLSVAVSLAALLAVISLCVQLDLSPTVQSTPLLNVDTTQHSLNTVMFTWWVPLVAGIMYRAALIALLKMWGEALEAATTTSTDLHIIVMREGSCWMQLVRLAKDHRRIIFLMTRLYLCHVGVLIIIGLVAMWDSPLVCLVIMQSVIVIFDFILFGAFVCMTNLLAKVLRSILGGNIATCCGCIMETLEGASTPNASGSMTGHPKSGQGISSRASRIFCSVRVISVVVTTGLFIRITSNVYGIHSSLSGAREIQPAANISDSLLFLWFFLGDVVPLLVLFVLTLKDEYKHPLLCVPCIAYCMRAARPGTNRHHVNLEEGSRPIVTAGGGTLLSKDDQWSSSLSYLHRGLLRQNSSVYETSLTTLSVITQESDRT